jgi:hypothetical protein
MDVSKLSDMVPCQKHISNSLVIGNIIKPPIKFSSPVLVVGDTIKQPDQDKECKWGKDFTTKERLKVNMDKFKVNMEKFKKK